MGGRLSMKQTTEFELQLCGGVHQDIWLKPLFDTQIKLYTQTKLTDQNTHEARFISLVNMFS